MASDDSSDEEVLVRTGNIPSDWYDDLPIYGYDIHGKSVSKLQQSDALSTHIAKTDNPDWWRQITDHLNAKKVKITDQLLQVIRTIRSRKSVGKLLDPYNDFDLSTPKQQFGINSAAPLKKSSFTPSKWQRQQVAKIAKAIQKGWIKKKQVKSEELWDLWVDQQGDQKPAPHKKDLPGHNQSYNPPQEYLYTQQELNEQLEKQEMNRDLNFVPAKYDAMRKVPGYENLIKQSFQRCLDLFLAPRIIRPKIDIDPESLIPQLPDPQSFRPFPEELAMVFSQHIQRVNCIDFNPFGDLMISGDSSGLVKIWESRTGKCLENYSFKSKVYTVAWNPVLQVVAIGTGKSVVIQPIDSVFEFSEGEIVDSKYAIWKYTPNLIEILLRKSVKQVVWHGKGSFFASFCKREALSKKIAIHSLQKQQTQYIFSKQSKGDIRGVAFHPKRPLFFVATSKNILTYNLKDQVLVKKFIGLDLPVHIHTHFSGDHILAACEDKRLLWFDYDSSNSPYKTFYYHKRSLTYVDTHSKYPLMATSARDKTVHVFHSKVYSDYLQPPLVLPLKIIHLNDTPGQCLFHPRQPWLAVTEGNLIKLFV